MKVGQSAPEFELPADDGTSFSLSKARGKNVIVYFYPRDDTPGCTTEAIEFSRARALFDSLKAVVVGISRDSIASHCRFRDKHGLSITLLSDSNLDVHKAYGAWGKKTLYGKTTEGTIRSTILIDPNGQIVKVWSPVKVAGHVDAVLEALGGGSKNADDAADDGASTKKKAPAAKTAKTTKATAKVSATAKRAAPKKASARS